MSLLAYFFLISIHLPTAQATSDLDDYTQLQFVVFGAPIGAEFELLPIQLLAPIEGTGVQYMIYPDGDLRTFEIVTAIDITASVQEAVEQDGNTFPAGTNIWSTFGWIETISGDTLAVAGFTKCSESESNWFYLTGEIPEEVLYSTSENSLAVATNLTAQLSEETIVEVAPPTLQSSGCEALDNELFEITTALESTLITEGDSAAMQSAIAIYEQAAITALDCEDDYDFDASVCDANLKNAQLLAQSTADNHRAIAVAAFVAAYSFAQILLVKCLFWSFFSGAAQCMTAFAILVAAALVTLGLALVLIALTLKDALAYAKAQYKICMAAADYDRTECLGEVEDQRNTLLYSILLGFTETSQSAISNANTAAEQIRSYFDLECYEHTDPSLANGLLLTWPNE